VRQRVARRPTLKLAPLIGAQDDLGGAASHYLNLQRAPGDSFQQSD
jgi:hypothetical protein